MFLEGKKKFGWDGLSAGIGSYSDIYNIHMFSLQTETFLQVPKMERGISSKKGGKREWWPWTIERDKNEIQLF